MIARALTVVLIVLGLACVSTPQARAEEGRRWGTSIGFQHESRTCYCPADVAVALISGEGGGDGATYVASPQCALGGRAQCFEAQTCTEDGEPGIL